MKGVIETVAAIRSLAPSGDDEGASAPSGGARACEFVGDTNAMIAGQKPQAIHSPTRDGTRRLPTGDSRGGEVERGGHCHSAAERFDEVVHRHDQIVTIIAIPKQAGITKSVIDAATAMPQRQNMFNHEKLMQEMNAQLAARKISGKDIADALKIDPSRVSEMRKGKRRLQIQEVEPLAKLLKFDEPQPLATREVVEIPVLGLASAGGWQEAVTFPSYTMLMARPSTDKKIAFAVEIHGDSMDLLLPEGGWAAVDTEQKGLFENRVYLIQNGDREATIKRYRNNPARFEPVSSNPDHKTFIMGEHAIDVIGRIVSYGNDRGL